MEDKPEISLDEREYLRKRIALFIHDIRTPLFAINCHSDNIAENLLALKQSETLDPAASKMVSSSAEQDLRALHEYADRCSSLVDGFWQEVSSLLEATPSSHSQTTDTFNSANLHVIERTCRVLVVDDNELNQQVGMNMLSALGCEVEVAIDGEEVFRRLVSESFDLIFMDLNLPRLDGCEITQNIKKTVKHAHIPVIGTTASPDDGDRQRGIAAGMDDCLSKPLTMEVLESLIHRYTL